MIPVFEKFTQKGNDFVKETAIELGHPEDLNRALRVLKAVLHALRDKISPQESLQLLAQLPLFIKAIYVDGWKWSGNGPKMRHLDEFIEVVKKGDGVTADYDFQTTEQIEESVRAVFRVLKRHVSEGEIADIVATLPTELKPLFSDAV